MEKQSILMSQLSFVVFFVSMSFRLALKDSKVGADLTSAGTYNLFHSVGEEKLKVLFGAYVCLHNTTEVTWGRASEAYKSTDTGTAWLHLLQEALNYKWMLSKQIVMLWTYIGYIGAYVFRRYINI